MSGLPASRCQVCGRLYCPPLTYCPAGCGRTCSPATVGSRGRIYSSTMVHIPHADFGAPYQIAYVDLDDGPRTFGRVRPDLPLLGLNSVVDVSLSADPSGSTTISFTPAQEPS